MKTLAEMIEVMKASLNGMSIQIKRHNEYDTWDDAGGELYWNWQCFDYRVKPEPQDWWIVVRPGTIPYAFANERDAKFEVSRAGGKVVHVTKAIE